LGHTITGDVPFTPEVFLDGEFHPVCLTGNSDDAEDVAAALCLQAGFPDGGRATSTGKVYAKDAVPIGQCGRGEAVENCMEREPSEVTCKAGEPVGVEITCHYQCRRFATFDSAYLETCHPFLDNNTHYYLADTPHLDKTNGQFGFSLVTQMADIVKNAMRPSCASNVMAIVCRSWFKECVQVVDASDAARGEIKLPALLCQSECQPHLDTWNSCVSEIETDAAALANFEEVILGVLDGVELASTIYFGETLPRGQPGNIRSPFRLPDCNATGGDADAIPGEDSALAWLFGQWPSHRSLGGTYSDDVASMWWPAGMNPVLIYVFLNSFLLECHFCLHSLLLY
jgi:hypothetical protein